MTTDFSKAWDMGDVTFTVEGRPLYGNKATLAMWSPVMNAMLFSDFKEKHARKIKLPGKSYDDILELFMVIHPPNKDVTESNVDVILELCQEYQMEALTGRCERYLVTIPPSVHWLVVAEEYNLPKLKAYCMKYIDGTRLRELSIQGDFDEISVETKSVFLMKKCNIYEPIIYAINDIVTTRNTHSYSYCSNLLLSVHTPASRQDCKDCMLYMINTCLTKLPRHTVLFQGHSDIHHSDIQNIL